MSGLTSLRSAETSSFVVFLLSWFPELSSLLLISWIGVVSRSESFSTFNGSEVMVSSTVSGMGEGTNAATCVITAVNSATEIEDW